MGGLSEVTQQAADPEAEDSLGCREVWELAHQPILSKYPLLHPAF